MQGRDYLRRNRNGGNTFLEKWDIFFPLHHKPNQHQLFLMTSLLNKLSVWRCKICHVLSKYWECTVTSACVVMSYNMTKMNVKYQAHGMFPLQSTVWETSAHSLKMVFIGCASNSVGRACEPCTEALPSLQWPWVWVRPVAICCVLSPCHISKVPYQ